MGFDPDRIKALETPDNTEDETEELASVVNSHAEVIVITDAIHSREQSAYFVTQVSRLLQYRLISLSKKVPRDICTGCLP
jgi:hypothetical protein